MPCEIRVAVGLFVSSGGLETARYSRLEICATTPCVAGLSYLVLALLTLLAQVLEVAIADELFALLIPQTKGQ
jgi:hypothetical protein